MLGLTHAPLQFATLCTSTAWSWAETQTCALLRTWRCRRVWLCGLQSTLVPESPLPAWQMNYTNKSMHNGQGLSAAMICAGWDAIRGGQVFSLPIGGSIVPVKWAVDGSGSSYIWGFCDAEFREGMSREQAEAFVLRATCLALSTDGSSGGCVRLVTVDATGAQRRYVPQTELPTFFGELQRPEQPGRGVVV